jgi:hypothetical protein
MLEALIGHLSDDEAIFRIGAHDVVVVRHEGKGIDEETEEIEDRGGEVGEEMRPAGMLGLLLIREDSLFRNR